MALTVDKLVHLSDGHNQHLECLAAPTGTTEDALIAKAFAIPFDLSEGEDNANERKAWGALSLNAFARV